MVTTLVIDGQIGSNPGLVGPDRKGDALWRTLTSTPPSTRIDRRSTPFSAATRGQFSSSSLDRDDVTLANPLGPPRLGRADVEKAVEAAAANFEDGSVRFEDLSRYATTDLGYLVYLERAEVRLAGSDEMMPSTLRVTMIFRHGTKRGRSPTDTPTPITDARPISTILTGRPPRLETR